jgi:hypothetical protein
MYGALTARWRVAVPAGRKFGDSVYGTRRAVYGVVAWILIVEWQSLPALAASLLAPAR